MKNTCMKCLLVMHLLGLGIMSFLHAQPSNFCGIDSQTTNNSQGLVTYNGDKAGDAGPDYNPSDLGANNLKAYYTIGPVKINNSITSGFWFNSGSNTLLKYNDVNRVNTKKSTVFRLSNVANYYNDSREYLTTRIQINTDGPAIQLNHISIASIQTALSGPDVKLNYFLLVNILDVSTNVLTEVAKDAYINSDRKVVNFVNPYTLLPGKTYEIQFRVANTNGYSTAYLDNPEIYGVPVPVVKSTSFSICNTSTNVSTLNSNLTSPSTIAGSGGTSVIRWFRNNENVPFTGNLAAGNSYTPYYYYNNSCYYPAGKPVLITMQNPPSITVSPTSQSVCVNSNVTFTSTIVNASSYSWYEDDGTGMKLITNGGKYSGANTTSLTISGVNAAMSGYKYTIQFSNNCTTSNSTFVTLTVNQVPTPQIQISPATCDADGTAVITNYAGTQTYVFSPSGPVVNSTGGISGLVAGTVYNVSSQNGSCSSVASSNFSIEAKKDCACYEAPNKSGVGLPSNFGISLLNRKDSGKQNWPGIRKSGHIVLESNSKGFVVTRVATSDLSKIVSPQEGMMVFDTTAQCLKIYADQKWSCFTTPACP